MEFKLLFAVFCLASIRMSEAAALTTNTAFAIATITDCITVGSAVTYNKPTVAGGTLPYTYSTTLTHVPTKSPVLFSISTAGDLTVATGATFSASTTNQYVVTVTLVDAATPALTNTGTFPIIVFVSACSSANAVIPSVAVLVLALLSMLFQKK